MSLQSKIDFAVIIRVTNANPNGDPLNGNRPRVDSDGYGEITDVCLKRKIRDRLQEAGEAIFVQSDEKKIDGMPSLRARAEHPEFGLGEEAFKSGKAARSKKTNPDPPQEQLLAGETSNVAAVTKSDQTRDKACAKWFDVRAFGQIFAFKGAKEKGDGTSIPIRGPVTIRPAFSVAPINITSNQITKSVSGETGVKKGADTMGMKHRVDSAIYVAYGSMNPQLAERTGFSDEDAETIKTVLPRLFDGDASSARPEGSMEVVKVIWWNHGNRSGKHSSAAVHRSLCVKNDGTYELAPLDDLVPEPIKGW